MIYPSNMTYEQLEAAAKDAERRALNATALVTRNKWAVERLYLTERMEKTPRLVVSNKI